MVDYHIIANESYWVVYICIEAVLIEKGPFYNKRKQKQWLKDAQLNCKPVNGVPAVSYSEVSLPFFAVTVT